MSYNAELWSRPDEESIRITLTCFMKEHYIQYDEEMTNEELRQLYIKYELGLIS